MKPEYCLQDVALVVIGRNEGERLRRCLQVATRQVSGVVYVDSGSTDGSLGVAGDLGVRCISLDGKEPFTAALARNAGAAAVLKCEHPARYLQFVDGDCELFPEWLVTARGFLQSNASVVAVCGRRRERFPEQSIYNFLCDVEWNTPIGNARTFGGDVMIRADAFNAVGGYRDALIAGEDPDLAIRLRQSGTTVWRLDVDMTLHDADITRFSQWWRRSVRAGYAYALGASLHGAAPERHWVQESRRAWLWGFAIPVLCVACLAAGNGSLALAVALVFPVQWMRLVISAGGSGRKRLASASFLMLGKFAEVTGGMKYLFDQAFRRQGGLIEYK